MRVSAVGVRREPIRDAVAYRVDTSGGAVLISGDSRGSLWSGVRVDPRLSIGLGEGGAVGLDERVFLIRCRRTRSRFR